MAVCCVTTKSRASLISATSASLVDGWVCSSSSYGPAPSAVRFRNGNAGKLGGATLSLSLCAVVASHRRSNRSEAGCLRLGHFEKRKPWGGVASASADATAVAESDEAEKSSEKDLIDQLLSLVQGSDSGAQFGKEEHAKVGEMVGQLEQYGIPEPLQSPLLFGDWDVAYSSNPMSSGGNYRTWIGRLIFRTREMFQAVSPPNVVVNVIQFSLFGFIPGEVQLRGKLEGLDEKLIRVDFQAPFFQLGPLKFQYGKVSSATIATIYLDDRMKLGRGSRGTIYVFTRR